MTTLPPPHEDPDGSHLMASLRMRLQRRSHGLGPEEARNAAYAPALLAVGALVDKRRSSGGCSLSELERLETLQADLEALSRGL